MLRNLNQSSGGQRILGVPQVGILAAQVAAETATGDHGPGILYNESQEAGYAGKYLRAVVTSWPATGALFEIAWTVPEGWAKDEAPDAIGKSLVFPPWFEDRREELMQGLEEAAFQ